MMDFYSQIVSPELQNDVLKEMKKEKLPLVIWGGGSMSYSVIKILKHNGIMAIACWIDNADILELDGMPVLSIKEIREKYGTVNVCYEQWKHLTYEFVYTHRKEYYATYDCLEDRLSQECMVAF